MKTKNSAFTLLEVTIALGLSCVVIYGMMQAYRNVTTYLNKAHDILGINRRVCLLFNQLERDFSTAYIPPLYKKEEKPEDVEKEKQKDHEILKTYFFAHVDEQESERIDSRRVHLFKDVAMINTNPLQVYGNRRSRLVRVHYILKLDKEKSKGERQCYTLLRKETMDLTNAQMKEREFSGETEKEGAQPVMTCLVADNIKKLYIEYVLKKQPDEQTGVKKEEAEEQFFDTWGESKGTEGVAPARVEVFIEFWDSQMRQSHKFRTAIAVLAHAFKPDDKKTFAGDNAANNQVSVQPVVEPEAIGGAQ